MCDFSVIKLEGAKTINFATFKLLLFSWKTNKKEIQQKENYNRIIIIFFSRKENLCANF